MADKSRSLLPEMLKRYDDEVAARRKAGEEIAVTPITAEDFVDIHDRAYRMVLGAQKDGARQISLLLSIFSDSAEVLASAFAAAAVEHAKRAAKRRRIARDRRRARGTDR